MSFLILSLYNSSFFQNWSSIILEVLLGILQFFYVLLGRLLVIDALCYSDVTPAIEGRICTFTTIALVIFLHWDGTLSIIELLLLFPTDDLSGLNRRRASADIRSHIKWCTLFQIGQITWVFVDLIMYNLLLNIETISSRWWTHNIYLCFCINGCNRTSTITLSPSFGLLVSFSE